VGEDICPVRWAGQQALVAFPEQMDQSNAGRIGEELLSVIDRGAAVLIADMTATIWCDHAGAGAVVRAFQRAVISGTELRLVVTAPIVSRVLSLSGVDRLVPIYPSLEAATAASAPAAALAGVAGPAHGGTGSQALPRRAGRASRPVQAAGPAGGNGEAITPALVGMLADVLQDGVVLADAGGMIALASTTGLPAEAAGQRIDEALGCLDEVIRQIRDAAFTAPGHGTPLRPAPPGGAAVARFGCAAAAKAGGAGRAGGAGAGTGGSQMMRVLLVEDEESFSDALSYLLRKQGFQVAVCPAGPDALEMFDRDGADLVLVDLLLPGAAGTDVCQSLRQRSNVPVIMLTATDTEAGRGPGLVADDYVTKPFTWHELAARIWAVLPRQKESGELPAAAHETAPGPSSGTSSRHVCDVPALVSSPAGPSGGAMRPGPSGSGR
jgi:anti-anti-sigma factor